MHKPVNVRRKILHEHRFVLEADDRSKILLGPQHALEESLTRHPLGSDGPLLAARDVDRHRYGDREISLSLERKNLLRFVVFEDLDVVLGEIVYVAILLVGDVERHGDKLRSKRDSLVFTWLLALGFLLFLVLLFVLLRLVGLCNHTGERPGFLNKLKNHQNCDGDTGKAHFFTSSVPA